MEKLLIACIFILTLQSCKEIISKNISESLPNLILPQSNDTVDINPVHFKWDELDGATKYHLQIVSPSFSNINTYDVDSIVAGTSIYLSLDSNEYELKLTAMNEGYESYTLGPIKFWVGVSAPESSASVILTTPTENEYVNENFNGLFTWQSVNNASSYEFSIRKGTSYQSSNIIETAAGIVGNQYTLNTILEEGEYHWGVKAYFNSGNETNVSTARLYVDTINPVIPALVSPTGTENPGSITFVWTNATDPGTVHAPVSSLLEVAEDINFTVGYQSASFSGTTGTLTVNGSGTRYWRMKNIDDAGNESSFSSVAQFTLF